MTLAALAFALAACTSDDPLDSSPGPVASPSGWRWESFGDVEISVPGDWGHGTGDVASALWCISDAGVGPPTVLRPGVEVESTCPGGPAGAPDPATIVAEAGTFVSLVYAASEPGVRLGVEGDRSTLRIGAVLLRVQAPESQRAAILATVRQISVDAHGCPISDSISTLPTRRPDAPVAVGELDDVRSVTACRYAIPGGTFAPAAADSDSGDSDDTTADEATADEATADEATAGSGTAGSGTAGSGTAGSGTAGSGTAGSGTAGSDTAGSDTAAADATAGPSSGPSAEPTELATDDPAAFEGDDQPAVLTAVAPLLPTSVPVGFPTLLSSVALDGDEARAAVRGIAASPRGVGPEADNGCADPFVRGTEAIVLRVTRASGAVEIYLHYGGCRNGFDDGVAERMLSRGAVAPFVAGANSVPVFGEELVRILDDPNAPATSGDPSDSGESPLPRGGGTGG